MELVELQSWIESQFTGVVKKFAYSETTYFYNPDQQLTNGVYFLTIKERNGPNDVSSNLDKKGVFRVSFKPDPVTYTTHFGKKPARPGKGKTVDLNYNFQAVDRWMPHPVYAWMGWTMVLNPSEETFQNLEIFIRESYTNAVHKFEKKTRNVKNH